MTYKNPEENTDPDICKLCGDTGEIEIMGGTEAEEWGVISVKRCVCLEDNED